ncbi:MAG: hypothetical protein M1831_004367 [Alyxoria varia]|nr:MAG: hypothetical protein M1831_004367 [Alyxoria varia]
MAAIPPPPPPPPQASAGLMLRLFNSKANDRLARFGKLLSTASGVDGTLLLVGYSLTLVHAILSRTVELRLRKLAKEAVSRASKSILPGETFVTALALPTPTLRLADIQSKAKKLAALISDVRTFLRLWGLVGVWAWAREITTEQGHKAKDLALKYTLWGQVFANAAFLVSEHGAYLADKGILTGWSTQKKSRWWVWSGRFFALHVVLEYIRLWRQRKINAKSREEANRDMTEKDAKISQRREDSTLRRELLVNIAYTPLVAHWSVENGLINDLAVGLLGTYAGSLGFRNAWKQIK